eukprot:CAMPEP_0119316536 /NCGR_PEP_ID=MMETSP1333-20130426/39898_1 /TAXON_ID=418940 /ORGANISM="Scyphosphaera apsteinii, Strain RCC1455" /LENGTH=545 /DNA_ID=CAMNT_0007322209 /DNA_START=129 /DNA_END=1766 /DNA_ORIENTATION=-
MIFIHGVLSEHDDAECDDDLGLDRCKKWATNGECSLVPTFMHRNCRSSCHACNKSLPGYSSPQLCLENDAAICDVHSQCTALAQQGFCVYWQHGMARYCAATCKNRDGDDGYHRSAVVPPWATESLYDFQQRNMAGCPDAKALAQLASASERCTDLEDVRRVSDRGFFVVRSAVPEEERARMFEFVLQLPSPVKFLCGASDVQPEECMLNGGRIIKALFPGLIALVQRLFVEWMEGGFSDEAELGWPLEIAGGEFISINAWRLTHNSSCLFNQLFNAAAPHASSCLALRCKRSERSDSTSPCWLTCIFDALINKMPRSELLQLITEASSAEATCNALDHDLLHAPFEYFMGGDGFWDFGERKYGGWGKMRLISNLRAWLTKVSNVPIYQGFHDWHIDGPAHVGRYHKVFVMVNKSTAPGHRQLTNLKLVPAHILHAQKCALKQQQDEWAAGVQDARHDSWRRLHYDEPHAKPSEAELDKASRQKVPLGFRNQWAEMEDISCIIDLDPGDLVFFREDVWHRTQDMILDRVAVIFDVLRAPLSSMFQ